MRLIDADALYKHFKQIKNDGFEWNEVNILGIIEDFPTIEERPRGKSVPFISHSEITDTIYIVCGANKYNVTEQVIKAMRATGRLSDYCPNCGADMRKEGDAE